MTNTLNPNGIAAVEQILTRNGMDFRLARCIAPDLIRAYQKEADKVSVSVEPLEWSLPTHHTVPSRADSLLGYYVAIEDSRGVGYWMHESHSHYHPVEGGIEAAKKAAFNHYFSKMSGGDGYDRS